jgi:hypothetical protein
VAVRDVLDPPLRDLAPRVIEPDQGLLVEAVSVEKLNPNILMMQSTQDRNRHDIADRLAWSEERRVLVQREMSTDPIVVPSVSGQDAVQVRLRRGPPNLTMEAGAMRHNPKRQRVSEKDRPSVSLLERIQPDAAGSI